MSTEVSIFEVVFTGDVTKKRKVWLEGRLKVGEKCFLTNDVGVLVSTAGSQQIIGAMLSKPNKCFVVGDEVTCGSLFLVQITGVLTSIYEAEPPVIQPAVHKPQLLAIHRSPIHTSPPLANGCGIKVEHVSSMPIAKQASHAVFAATFGNEPILGRERRRTNEQTLAELQLLCPDLTCWSCATGAIT